MNEHTWFIKFVKFGHSLQFSQNFAYLQFMTVNVCSLCFIYLITEFFCGCLLTERKKKLFKGRRSCSGGLFSVNLLSDGNFLFFGVKSWSLLTWKMVFNIFAMFAELRKRWSCANRIINKTLSSPILHLNC